MPAPVHYDRAQWRVYHSERDFLQQLAASGRWFRNRRNQILFKIAPGDFVHLTRATEFAGILGDPQAKLFACPHEMNDDEWRALWHAVADHRWRLPIVNGADYADYLERAPQAVRR